MSKDTIAGELEGSLKTVSHLFAAVDEDSVAEASSTDV